MCRVKYVISCYILVTILRAFEGLLLAKLCLLYETHSNVCKANISICKTHSNGK